MSREVEFTADDVRELLDELGRRLEARGIEAEVYVVGGAAIALRHDRRRLTADIDAVVVPHDAVMSEAKAMARERGLPTGWLATGAGAWVPGASADTDATEEVHGGLTVRVASPRVLLAMKLIAMREKDRSDLATLVAELGIDTPEAAADLAAEVYGDHHELPDRSELLLIARAALKARR